jgi:hypothetical protein
MHSVQQLLRTFFNDFSQCKFKRWRWVMVLWQLPERKRVCLIQCAEIRTINCVEKRG